jgi:glutamate synthase domain-containing protein 3/Pyruvate/2-oxoacid:ferredoxin oxidoreductase delta subunit
MYKIKTLVNDVRMSTQELLQLINKKIEEGECEFEIEACGQHNIGGFSWSRVDGKGLSFKIKNAGQRVGAMAMEGTKIVVDGSAPADIGWLNSGATIVVKGDAGDTAAHCAAGGKIYVGGRVGTRSGALMKHDPKFEPPEFWVLKNTGSFSFEFMGGGVAVVCGYESEQMSSVLGNRSCVGMVGGVVYVRGNVDGLSDCVEVKNLDKFDKDFLKAGMPEFLKEIDRKELGKELLDFSQWKKLVPKSQKDKAKKISVKDFKDKEWNGLFNDLVDDNGELFSLANTGEGRLRKPVWTEKNCIGCNLCLNNCPQHAIVKDEETYSSIDDKCIGCGICAGICPKSAWTIEKNILTEN